MMDSTEMMDQARGYVSDYAKHHLEKTDPDVDFETYVVWFSRTLDNWKALVSTTLPDGKYYEVTHSGLKEETYLDVYVKIDNIFYPMS